MTRDTASNPSGGGTRGPRRPADRRHPDATAAGEESWSSGLTGPQRTFPVWDGVPGYEFEGRRASQRPPPPEALPPQTPAPQTPAARPPEGGGARRFRYTQTVSQPVPVASAAWDDQPEPGFEFGTTPPTPGPTHRSGARSNSVHSNSVHSNSVHSNRVHSNSVHSNDAHGTEWGRLLRSFVPEPVKRNWFAEFRSALHFRGAGVRVIIPIVAMMIFGVAVAVIAGANGSHNGPAPPPTALGFAPATLAGNAFSAAATGRGINQTLGRVASDGAEIVAAGSQQGARIARAQFFVSTDDGRTWSMGHVRNPDGSPPPPGYAARFVAGGPGAWVALGPSSIWTSPDGRTWTLSSTVGLPLRPGDQINVVKRTATGFIAVGSAGSAPLVFLSANGTTWQRLAPRLSAGTGRVLDIRYAAAYGHQILIAGDVAIPGKQTKTSAAWLSGNGGTTWTLAIAPGAPGSPGSPGNGTPAGHGALAQISGVTVTAEGFVLFRPATTAGKPAVGKTTGRKPAVDVYRSANGTAWTFAATLAAKAGFTTDMVDGAPAGAVITGQSGPGLIAFTSANGASWRPIPAFGTAATQDVSGVAIAQGGTVVAAGTTTGDPDSRQPLLTVIAANGHPANVDIGKIPGAADPELAVNDVAVGNGMQVAVGSANGYLAAWASANGGTTWTRATGQSPAVLDRPGIQQLTSVADGADGWLAVGSVVAVAPPHPVVLTSGNGSAWTAADGEPAFSQPGLVTEQAAASPTGYVIVGYQSAAGRTVAAAWYSAGLTGWQRATVSTPGTQDQMRAVTAGPHGFVAVGAAGNAPAAWTSPNGQAWTQQNVPLPVGATRAVLQYAASNGRTVVAVGTALTTAGQQLPFAASSADGGRTWAESALPVPAGHAFVTALTATGAGGQFLATGTFGSGLGHQDVVVWTSPAGASGSPWQVATPTGQGLTGNGIQAITGLDVSDRILTGVGFTASPSGEQPVFWQSPVR
ncbi:MAG: hypothetical protein ACRDP5_15550 [Streptosporangiaceae bacterium]